MKIASVETIGLSGRTPPAGWGQEVHEQENLQTLIILSTDAGISGVGTSYTSQALVDASIALLGGWLIGESALEPERVAEKLHRMSFWQGRGGAITHVISGIDIALWDIMGKACGQPVARLLGGCYRTSVRPYASMLFDGTDTLAARLEKILALGFRSVKLGWRPFGRVDAATDEKLVKTARDFVGPDVEMMVDAGASDDSWSGDYKWAVRAAEMLAYYDVSWFEEALCPDDIDAYRLLRERSPVRVAAGEVMTRRQSFRELLNPPAVDIVQPDCTKVGGLSEARRIGWYASEHGVRLVPHGWNNAVGLSADLQLAAALPHTDRVEYITPSAYIDELSLRPFEIDQDGMLEIPMEPGLGVDLDPDALDYYKNLAVAG